MKDEEVIKEDAYFDKAAAVNTRSQNIFSSAQNSLNNRNMRHFGGFMPMNRFGGMNMNMNRGMYQNYQYPNTTMYGSGNNGGVYAPVAMSPYNYPPGYNPYAPYAGANNASYGGNGGMYSPNFSSVNGPVRTGNYSDPINSGNGGNGGFDQLQRPVPPTFTGGNSAGNNTGQTQQSQPAQQNPNANGSSAPTGPTSEDYNNIKFPDAGPAPEGEAQKMKDRRQSELNNTSTPTSGGKTDNNTREDQASSPATTSATGQSNTQKSMNNEDETKAPASPPVAGALTGTDQVSVNASYLPRNVVNYIMENYLREEGMSRADQDRQVKAYYAKKHAAQNQSQNMQMMDPPENNQPTQSTNSLVSPEDEQHAQGMWKQATGHNYQSSDQPASNQSPQQQTTQPQQQTTQQPMQKTPVPQQANVSPQPSRPNPYNIKSAGGWPRNQGFNFGEEDAKTQADTTTPRWTTNSANTAVNNVRGTQPQQPATQAPAPVSQSPAPTTTPAPVPAPAPAPTNNADQNYTKFQDIQKRINQISNNTSLSDDQKKQQLNALQQEWQKLKASMKQPAPQPQLASYVPVGAVKYILETDISDKDYFLSERGGAFPLLRTAARAIAPRMMPPQQMPMQMPMNYNNAYNQMSQQMNPDTPGQQLNGGFGPHGTSDQGNFIGNSDWYNAQSALAQQNSHPQQNSDNDQANATAESNVSSSYLNGVSKPNNNDPASQNDYNALNSYVQKATAYMHQLQPQLDSKYITTQQRQKIQAEIATTQTDVENTIKNYNSRYGKNVPTPAPQQNTSAPNSEPQSGQGGGNQPQSNRNAPSPEQLNTYKSKLADPNTPQEEKGKIWSTLEGWYKSAENATEGAWGAASEWYKANLQPAIEAGWDWTKSSVAGLFGGTNPPPATGTPPAAPKPPTAPAAAPAAPSATPKPVVAPSATAPQPAATPAAAPQPAATTAAPAQPSAESPRYSNMFSMPGRLDPDQKIPTRMNLQTGEMEWLSQYPENGEFKWHKGNPGGDIVKQAQEEQSAASNPTAKPTASPAPANPAPAPAPANPNVQTDEEKKKLTNEKPVDSSTKPVPQPAADPQPAATPAAAPQPAATTTAPAQPDLSWVPNDYKEWVRQHSQFLNDRIAEIKTNIKNDSRAKWAGVTTIKSALKYFPANIEDAAAKSDGHQTVETIQKQLQDADLENWDQVKYLITQYAQSHPNE